MPLAKNQPPLYFFLLTLELAFEPVNYLGDGIRQPRWMLTPIEDVVISSSCIHFFFT